MNPLPSLDVLTRLLALDADEGRLYRKVRKTLVLVPCGRATPYATVSIKGRVYAQHRIIYYMATGDMPDTAIDHIDRDKRNNRPSNLRKASKSDNAHNYVRCRKNKLGIRGVSATKRGTYEATIRRGYKVIRIGEFETPELAAEAYRNAAIAIYGDSACTE